LKNRKTLVTAIQIAALLAVILAVVKLWPKDAVDVGVVRLESGDVLDMVTTVSSGTVKAARYARIRSSAIGDSEKVLAHKGDTVKKGAVVVLLKNREHKARLNLARANLEAGNASRRQTEIRKGQFDRNFDRTQKLFDQKVAAESSFEQVKTERDVSAEMVTAADATIAQLKAALDIAEASYDSTFIRAPFDGTIASVSVEEGEAVSIGLPVFEIYDGSSVKIEAALDEADSTRVTVGMPVSLSTNAAPGTVIEGKVTWIAPMVTHDIKGSRSVDITIEPAKPEPSLRVGMSVDIEIIVARHRDASYLPTTAIIGKGTEKHVLAVKNGFAVKKMVKTGITNWEMTEILSGLDRQEQVIFTLNAPGLVPGAAVRVNPSLAPAKGRQ